ncbi:MAG: ClpXP protease specificity-enhancing factor [Coxiellaceae bacterium]|nr:ClpXP protease specificity-enhancing factor [Coxiellaceae bacterium]
MMTSSRPYLIRAIYDWVVDNALTPYILVDATLPNVAVPERFIEDGKIILNLAPQAIGGLALGNEAIEFDARFSGVAQHVYVPIRAVKAVYAFENGRGMVFGEDDEDGGSDGPINPTGGGASGGSQPPAGGKPTGKPTLTVVK